MSVSRPAITPELIDSTRALRSFFNRSPDLDKVKKQAGKPSYQYGRGSLIMGPVHVCAYVFCSMMSFLSSMVGAKNLALRTHLWAWDYGSRVSELFLRSSAHKELLVPIRNFHRIDTSSYYLSSPFTTSNGTFSFPCLGGQCRGISEWFNFLYLKTRSRFTSAEDHIKAVSKRFRKGSPIDSALIQSIGKYCKSVEVHTNALGRHKWTIIPLSPKTHTNAKLAERIFKLPRGCYSVSFPAAEAMHGIVFIREQNKYFVVDPNFGAFKISNSRGLGEIFDEYITQSVLSKTCHKFVGVSRHQV